MRFSALIEASAAASPTAAVESPVAVAPLRCIAPGAQPSPDTGLALMRRLVVDGPYAETKEHALGRGARR